MNSSLRIVFKSVGHVTRHRIYVGTYYKGLDSPPDLECPEDCPSPKSECLVARYLSLGACFAHGTIPSSLAVEPSK
eukprot:scaffold5234_cov112-Skeletonema_dohrnii-CCMP3373.AAC.4